MTYRPIYKIGTKQYVFSYFLGRWAEANHKAEVIDWDKLDNETVIKELNKLKAIQEL